MMYQYVLKQKPAYTTENENANYLVILLQLDIFPTFVRNSFSIKYV